MEYRVRKIEFGVMRYGEALERQEALFEDVKSGSDGAFVVVEHPHIYTLGKSGDDGNLLIDEKRLESLGAEFHRTNRGGDITYHGYGQVVGYPIVDIVKMGISLREYIWGLEQMIIDVMGEYGIVSERVSSATGVWVDGSTPKARKIAAIGVKASRGVTMHGFALNVATDLSYFGYINPCGMTLGVTSMKKEGVSVSFNEVSDRLFSYFESGEFLRAIENARN